MSACRYRNDLNKTIHFVNTYVIVKMSEDNYVHIVKVMFQFRVPTAPELKSAYVL
jgi:hypothetical protein